MTDEAVSEQYAVIFFSILRKKSDTDDTDNYRSIALINTIVKTLNRDSGQQVYKRVQIQ